MRSYVPWTTRSHTATAEDGTEMYRDTWNSSRELAMPAKFAITLVRFANTSAAITTNVVRSPYSSRMRSDSPLPVTAPMREHISCVTISRKVIGMSVHRRWYPKRAPACE